MKFKKYFKPFVKALYFKMQEGYKVHTDKSFSKPPENLLAEIQEECLDICGWGLVLWIRLEELRNKLIGGKDE